MKMWMTAVLLGAIAATGSCAAATEEGQPAALRVKAPKFQDITEWVNTKPLAIADLRGEVVVVHFWAFG